MDWKFSMSSALDTVPLILSRPKASAVMLQVHLHDERGDFRDPNLVIDRFPSVLGRHSACDQRLNSAFVSRRHCSFFVKDGQVWVQDLESSNGTFLNGVRLDRPKVVCDGDHLGLGPTPFRVSVTETTEPRRSRPLPEESQAGRRGSASVEHVPC